MKGLVFSTGQFIASLFLIAIVIYVLYMWHISYFDINFIVSIADEQRKMINLGQIILSYPEITVIKDGRLERAVMDAGRMGNLPSLCGDVLYPKTSYDVEIKDLDTGSSWSVSCGSITPDTAYQIYVPLSIKHSDIDVNPGEMNLTFYVEW